MKTNLDFDLKGKKIFVCGHRGMVGRAVVRRLESEFCEIITALKNDLNLQDEKKVNLWFKENRPDAVIIAAAKVGGIAANNSLPVDFLLNNLRIQNSVIRAAFENEVSKLLFLGSSCIYPVNSRQPITEDTLLSGPLEPTNEWYAIAKIAGLKLCQAYRQQYGANFITAMPTNLYGPFDNFHPTESHVVAALIAKIHLAKTNNHQAIKVWGSGNPKREFMYVDDLADGLVYLMKYYSAVEPINVGSGDACSIRELTRLIGNVANWDGELQFDASMPDGAPIKVMDNTKIHDLGWRHETNLIDGLRKAFDWYENNQRILRK